MEFAFGLGVGHTTEHHFAPVGRKWHWYYPTNMNQIRLHYKKASTVQVKWHRFAWLRKARSAVRRDDRVVAIVGSHIMVLHIGHNECMAARRNLVHVPVHILVLMALSTHMGTIVQLVLIIQGSIDHIENEDGRR